MSLSQKVFSLRRHWKKKTAFLFYGELYSSLKDSGIDSGTKQVLQEQFLENIYPRLTMQLELYESGKRVY